MTRIVNQDYAMGQNLRGANYDLPGVRAPHVIYGTTAPAADVPFTNAPLGTEYIYLTDTTATSYRKMANTAAAADWIETAVVGVAASSQTIAGTLALTGAVTLSGATTTISSATTNLTGTAITLSGATTAISSATTNLTGATTTLSGATTVISSATTTLSGTAIGISGAATFTGVTKINSKNFATSSGDIIGYQCKPAGNATGTATVYGSQISPRFNHGVAGADIIGVQSNPILKGTAAAGGDLSGNVRAFEARLESESGGTRTVTGGLFGIQFMNQLFSTITATGGVYPISVLTHSNTLAWSGFAKLPADGNIAKYSSGHYGTLGAIDGAIQVMVGSTALWVPCYVSIAA